MFKNFRHNIIVFAKQNNTLERIAKLCIQTFRKFLQNKIRNNTSTKNVARRRTAKVRTLKLNAITQSTNSHIRVLLISYTDELCM